MKKEDLMVSTLPIKPQKETNIGMMLAPTIMDYIGDVFDIERNIGFNILHSYDDKNIEMTEYLNYVNQAGIQYDSIFIDGDNADELLEIVEEMYYNGYLKIKEKELLRCDCGRVDMIYSLNNNAKLYSVRDNKIYCNHCGKECHKIVENSLVFELKIQNEETSMIPFFLKKELEGFNQTFDGTDILVSKIRDTGYSVVTKEGLFNVDVDFLWMNYFKLFDQTNQIYVASNHQLFVMYLMNYIANTTSDKKLTFIASPYINVDLKEAKKQYEMRNLKEYKSLLLLYNLKWKNKHCDWSDSNTKYLTNISDTKIKNLYESMLISSRELQSLNLSFDEIIYRALNESTNMQNNIKTMKKMYKRGNV